MKASKWKWNHLQMWILYRKFFIMKAQQSVLNCEVHSSFDYFLLHIYCYVVNTLWNELNFNKGWVFEKQKKWQIQQNTVILQVGIRTHFILIYLNISISYFIKFKWFSLDKSWMICECICAKLWSSSDKVKRIKLSKY